MPQQLSTRQHGDILCIFCIMTRVLEVLKKSFPIPKHFLWTKSTFHVTLCLKTCIPSWGVRLFNTFFLLGLMKHNKEVMQIFKRKNTIFLTFFSSKTIFLYEIWLISQRGQYTFPFNIYGVQLNCNWIKLAFDASTL